MSDDASDNVTQVLSRMQNGDAAAATELMDIVYGELRALAGGYFKRQRDNHTLQPTALVHEAFLRLVRADAEYSGREHFFAVAATAMRQILTSHARKKRATKRGGEAKAVTLSNVVVEDAPSALDIVVLDDVLSELERLNERQARIVEYRFFGGLTMEEIAKVLAVSVTTVEKDWRRARAWLATELSA
jgi:RNA polymerase sigma-70 factor (ECF subfamily)